MPETQSQNISNVLVVDDEQIMQDVMRDILEASGYDVEVAANGEEALGLLKLKNYNLVFADVRMPKMDGIELLKRAKDSMPRLDIIMMTGFASVEALLAFLRQQTRAAPDEQP